MASKKSKDKKENRPASNPDARRVKTLQIIFVVLSALMILAMILSSIATSF